MKIIHKIQNFAENYFKEFIIQENEETIPKIAWRKIAAYSVYLLFFAGSTLFFIFYAYPVLVLNEPIVRAAKAMGDFTFEFIPRFVLIMYPIAFYFKRLIRFCILASVVLVPILMVAFDFLTVNFHL